MTQPPGFNRVHNVRREPLLNVCDGACSEGTRLLFACERCSDEVTGEPVAEQRVILKASGGSDFRALSYAAPRALVALGPRSSIR